MKLVKLSACFSLVVAVACGGSQPPAESAPPAAADAPAGGDAPAPAAFHDMNRDQRMMFMKETVMPAMQAEFQKFDAKRYAEFSCATCHGSGAKSGTFTMPNPELPKLPATPDGFKALGEKHPDMMKFMGEVVKPKMQELLKEEPFDPATGKGFGCMECHTTG
jgi:hypothetical protein